MNRYIAGYQWGAKLEDSSIKMLVGYSNDFSDPSKCAGVAKGQMAAGADIVFSSDRIAVMYEGRIVSFEPANAPEERLGLLMAGGGHRQEHTSA